MQIILNGWSAFWICLTAFLIISELFSLVETWIKTRAMVKIANNLSNLEPENVKIITDLFGANRGDNKDGEDEDD